MAYAILRTKKMKSKGAIVSAGKHNDREVETPNADKEIQNYTIIGKDKTYLEHFEEATKDIKKIRKNAVYAVEFFMSTSPEAEFFKNSQKLKNWTIDSTRFLQKKFGKENIKKVTLHLDETTPHIHALVVPIKDKKLSYKYFLGGSKFQLSELQSDYAEVVRQYNLERGIEGSKAKHQDVKKYYSALNEVSEDELPQPKILESKEKYKKRADKEYKKVKLQNLDLKLKVARLKEQVPKRYTVKRQLNTGKKEIEDRKIINFLDQNQQVKKEILKLLEIKEQSDKIPVKTKDKNRNDRTR